MRVPLLDLAAQLYPLRAEILDAVGRVIDSGRFVLGPNVEAFERAVAERVGVAHGVGVSSGSDALWVALASLGVGPGDTVVTTAYSFYATAGAIVRLGAKPVFVDVEAETLGLCPDALERFLEERPEEARTVKAIVVAHLFGRCAETTRVCALADRIGAAVVEDAAQAFGATLADGAPAGSAGAAACFSFYPSKTLGGLGDGGMMVTRDPEVAERARRLRNHGLDPDGLVRRAGGNFRLDEVQAAALSVMLPHHEDWIRARRRNAARYDEALEGTGLLLPAWAPGHAYTQYVVHTGRRDALRAHLAEAGVATETYYARPLSAHPAYRMEGEEGAYPKAERAARTNLALPVYPALTDEALDYVIASVLSAGGAR